MKFQSFRSAVVFASVIVGSVIPSQAFAEFEVFVSAGFGGTSTETLNTVYTFSSPMILNSIAIYGGVTQEFAISTLNNGDFVNASTSLIGTFNVEAEGVRWFNLSSPITLNKDDTVSVRTSGGTQQYRHFQILGPSSNVTHVFSLDAVNASNSNLRVSALPPNIAPEPGSLALALIGGCALVGMHIRRRRMSN
jgi:hypothetical protein